MANKMLNSGSHYSWTQTDRFKVLPDIVTIIPTATDTTRIITNMANIAINIFFPQGASRDLLLVLSSILLDEAFESRLHFLSRWKGEYERLSLWPSPDGAGTISVERVWLSLLVADSGSIYRCSWLHIP